MRLLNKELRNEIAIVSVRGSDVTVAARYLPSGVFAQIQIQFFKRSSKDEVASGFHAYRSVNNRLQRCPIDRCAHSYPE